MSVNAYTVLQVVQIIDMKLQGRFLTTTWMVTAWLRVWNRWIRCTTHGHVMQFKHLGTDRRSNKHTFLHERPGMFYKAARSRAQANGKVRLNHRNVQWLKVKEQSLNVWGDGTRTWQGVRSGQHRVWSGKLSIWSHVNRCPSNLYLIRPSINLSGGLWKVATTFNRLLLGKKPKQAQSITEKKITKRLIDTFHLR